MIILWVTIAFDYLMKAALVGLASFAFFGPRIQHSRSNKNSNWPRGGGGIFLCFKSSALDFPKDLASGGCLPPASVGLSSASAEKASPGCKSWRIEAPPPSRSEKRRHPVITYEKLLCPVRDLRLPGGLRASGYPFAGCHYNRPQQGDRGVLPDRERRPSVGTLRDRMVRHRGVAPGAPVGEPGWREVAQKDLGAQALHARRRRIADEGDISFSMVR